MFDVKRVIQPDAGTFSRIPSTQKSVVQFTGRVIPARSFSVMKMIDIRIPTDKLHKFAAIAGLLFAVGVGGGTVYSGFQLSFETFNHTQEREELAVEWEKLNREYHQRIVLAKSYGPNRQQRELDAKSLFDLGETEVRAKSAALETKIAKTTALQKLVDDHLPYAVLVAVVGLAVSVWGFKRWLTAGD